MYGRGARYGPVAHYGNFKYGTSLLGMAPFAIMGVHYTLHFMEEYVAVVSILACIQRREAMRLE